MDTITPRAEPLSAPAHREQAPEAVRLPTIGTITVAPSGTTGSFVTSGGAVSLVAGDRLAIVGPDPADATLADIAITLKGTRTS